MGLDMYLKASKHTYVSEYENRKDYPAELRKRGFLEQTICEIELPKEFDMYGSRSLECTAMYWRKVNAVHNWFVENVQDGQDDCRSYYVSAGQLTELLETIGRVLEDNALADELLPTASGCFFGNTEYDEGYFEDLMHTYGRLQAILAMPDRDSWSFKYQSSW